MSFTPTFYDMTYQLSDLLLNLFLTYLEIDDRSRLRFDYEIFMEEGVTEDDLEEVWALPFPEHFECELSMDDVVIPGMSLGKLQFGRYNGRKVILEQNASPLMVYWRDC